jgi:hypothetical protein
MSWIDKINNVKLEIQTGDGKKWYPLWKEAKKNIRYNVEGFDFVDIYGTYVDRKKQSGNQFPVLFFFQGEDHLNESQQFEYSASDSRPWIIRHPIYGSIKVHPVSLNFDNSAMNVTAITGMLWETIETKYPKVKINSKLIIRNKRTLINETNSNVFDNNINGDTGIIDATLVSSEILDRKYSLLTDVFENVNILKDLVRKAYSAGLTVISQPITFMNYIQGLINFPLIIEQNVDFKIKQLKESFDETRELIFRDEFSNNSKQLYMSYSFAYLSALCDVSANPLNTDYYTRSDVLRVIDDIITFNNLIIQDFDYIGITPNTDLAFNVDSIVNETVANLYDIAFNSKQDRTAVLQVDSNIVVLAHKYFGTGDANLNAFIEANALTNEELIRIKAGRIVNYYA